MVLIRVSSTAEQGGQIFRFGFTRRPLGLAYSSCQYSDKARLDLKKSNPSLGLSPSSMPIRELAWRFLWILPKCLATHTPRKWILLNLESGIVKPSLRAVLHGCRNKPTIEPLVRVAFSIRFQTAY